MGSAAVASLEVNVILPGYAGVVLLCASCEVTVNDPGVPAIVEAGKPVSKSLVVAPGFTRMPPWLPVMLAVAVSVAVMENVDIELDFFSVTLNTVGTRSITATDTVTGSITGS